MFFGRRNTNTVLKKDSQVVRDLEDVLYQSLREAQTAIAEGDEEAARKRLTYAKRLKKIRGYETVSDMRFDEVFSKYLDKFPNKKAS